MQLTAICGRLPESRWRYSTKIMWKAMRLTVILLTVALMQVSAKSFSQEVSLNARRASLEKIFKEIESQTGYVFFYNKPVMEGTNTVSIEVEKAPLEFLLNELLKNQPLRYAIYNKTIIISRKTSGTPGITYNAPVQQEPVVKGIVLSKDGNGLLAGATVVNVKTKKTTLVDDKGRFTIAAKPGESLLITNVGYMPRSIIITEANRVTEFMVAMERSTSELDAIQVLAYGKTTKRFNTGNVTTVTAEEIAKNPVPNVLAALQHKVPGMFVQQQTGLPGGRFNVEVRGTTSFFQTPPLFIVDGVAYPGGSTLPFLEPFSGAGTNGDSRGLRGGNALNFLDPSMIESVDILKDADATSIYGSRGAYGVVLITTKKGKMGVPRLSATVRQSYNVRGTSPKLLNTEQYLMLRREAFANNNATPGISDYDLNGTYSQTSYTDWEKQVSGLYAPMFDGNLSYSGGSGNVNYLIRGNFSTQKNTQRDKGAYRNLGGGFDINTTSKNGKIFIDLSGNYSSTFSDLVSWDFALGSLPIRPPNAPALFNPDGSLNWTVDGKPTASNGALFDNPASALMILYKSIYNTFLTNLNVEYKPIPGMVIQLRGGYTVITGSELRAEPSVYFNPLSTPIPTEQANSQRLFSSSRTLTFDPNIRYGFKAGSEGKLNLTAGMTMQDQFDYSNTIRSSNFFSDAMLINPVFGDVQGVPTYTQTPNRYLGYFAAANYSWANKYIINLTGRYDGSTKFGKDKQFGTFGSVGGLWIVSEEPFFKSLRKVVSFLKFRGSYGTSGGDGIGNYGFIDRYSRVPGNSYQGTLALAPSSIANPNLQWETSKKAEGAIELGFLQDKIYVTASYYNTKTSNQLIAQPLSVVTGFETFQMNSPALIQNTGFELMVMTRNIKRKDFSWTTNMNFTVPRNKLLKYPDIKALTVNLNYEIGKSMNGIKLYRYAGVDPETGNRNFYNKAGVKGEYASFAGPSLDQLQDRTEFVDLTPKYYGGITNDFTYKNFSLGFSIGFTNRIGQNFISRNTFGFGLLPQNGSVELLNRWQKKGDITDIPRLTSNISTWLTQNNFGFSTGAYERATYARLNNLNFGYDLPKALLQRIHLTNVRVMAQGQNLLTVSKYKQLDPENLGAGTAPYRTYTAGLNISL